MIDEESAKHIARQFLEQYYTVVRVEASLDDMTGRQQWHLAAHTTKRVIKVVVDAKDGKILGYSAKA